MMNLVGKRYGRLTVLSEGPRKENGRARTWFCRCDCGQERCVRQGGLMSKQTQSCGCLGKENLAKALLKHGHDFVGKRTPEYRSWTSARNRCQNPNNDAYHLYGGRGIKVHPSWELFSQFLADMGLRPSIKHSLDRIDTYGDYSPENCRWATHIVQENNKRNNRRLTKDGRTQTQAQWCRELGLKSNTVTMRLQKGDSDEQALRPVSTNRGHSGPR